MFRNIKMITTLLMGLAVLIAGVAYGTDSTVFAMAAVGFVSRGLLMFAPHLQLASGIGSVLMRGDGDEVEQLIKNLKGLESSLQQKQKGLEAGRDELLSRMTKGEQVSQETKDNLDKAVTTINEVKSQMSDVMQKIEGIKAAQPAPGTKSYGHQVAADTNFVSALKERRGGRMELKYHDYKAITTTGAAGLIGQPYQDSLVSLERQGLTIRDLLTVIPVSDASIEYAQQSVRTNNAATVKEGEAKPYSNYEWIKKTANVVVVAHLAKISNQAVWDAPRLVAEVDSEMRYGLGLAEEQKLLNGNGVDGDILGIMPQATAFAIPSGITPHTWTKLDILRIAQLNTALRYAPADAQVLNPIDWTDIELTRRDTDGNGGYLFANVQSTVNPILWGLRVVQTPAMVVDNFLVGAFKYGAHLYDRMGVSVVISSENADDFEKNMNTMRCEERIGLGVRRTYAFEKGTFTGAIAGGS